MHTKSSLQEIMKFKETLMLLTFGHIMVIIEYFGSTLNAYSLFSQKWWVLLIKFMIGSTTSMREESIHVFNVLLEYFIIFR